MESFIEFIRIVIYFFTYSFFGWILESIYKSFRQKKIVNSGFLYGPFCPIYGLGALIMYFVLSGYNENPIHVFIIGFVVLSVWEYIVAWALEKLFNTKYWDYSNYKYNINGRVCLLNSFFWGVLGILFIYLIHPVMKTVVIKVDSKILLFISVILSIGMIVDTIINIAKMKDISKKIEDVKNIRNQIKSKLEELKKINNNKESRKEAIQLLINDLKTQELNVKEKLIKQTSRIRKAFPSMQSDIIKQISKYIRK